METDGRLGNRLATEVGCDEIDCASNGEERVAWDSGGVGCGLNVKEWALWRSGGVGCGLNGEEWVAWAARRRSGMGGLMEGAVVEVESGGGVGVGPVAV